MTIELEAELNYYLNNRNKLSKAKEHLTSLHGIDGFNWLLDKTAVKPNKSIALSNRLTFKRKVQALTEKQPLYLLENFEKRGFKTGYHVDHIVSIYKAYYLGWTVEQCADISNLQMLPFEDNLKKGIHYMETTLFCLTDKAFNWIIFKCEDEVSLTHFEEDWDGCIWIPVSALLDYMTQETLTKLTASVRTFTLEDTQAFDAKHLISA